MQEWAVHGVQQEWFPTVDLLPPSLLDIGRGLKVIQDCKVKCKSVYVHCKAGKGRSATVTACYLIKVNLLFNVDLNACHRLSYVSISRDLIANAFLMYYFDL